MNTANTSKNVFVASYPNRGVTFIKGDGVYLFDQNGEKYLDLGSNYGVNIFGYNHPAITKALHQQLDKLVNLHGSFNSTVRSQAAEKLLEVTGGKLSKIFFSNSGAESTEAALKFAKVATGKSHFIAMKNSYHGKTLGALSATAGDKYRNPFLPLLWNFTHVNFGNIEELKSQITQNTGAIIIEPVQGEAGVIVPDEGYLKKAFDLCKSKNVLLICDEVQTGLGRTGKMLASDHENVKPDILILGKALSGGVMPISAVLARDEIMLSIKPGEHGSTFGGNPLACKVAIASLQVLVDEKLADNAEHLGKIFREEMTSLMQKTDLITKVRGKGLLNAIVIRRTESGKTAWDVCLALKENGLLAKPTHGDIIRFAPPLVINGEELKFAVDTIIKVIMNFFIQEYLRPIRYSRLCY